MSGLFGGGKNVNQSSPIVNSLRVQTSCYGRPIPLAYGKTRVSGFVLQAENFWVRMTDSGGGKGGGGSPKTANYYVSPLIGICHGTIVGVMQIWAGSNQYASLSAFVQGTAGVRTSGQLFLGTANQQPFSWYNQVAQGRVLSYPLMAYIGIESYGLGSDPSLPNHTFEVATSSMFTSTDGITGIVDAHPFCVMLDLITNPVYGALTNVPSSIQNTDVQDWFNYVTAAGLFVSPVYDQQETLAEIMDRLLTISNGALFVSDGVFKIKTYADSVVIGNGQTFTPNTTPVYNLTDDDILESVKVTRTNPADAYNLVPVEFYNRDNNYNTSTVYADDISAINLYGLRKQDPITLHEICSQSIAMQVAQIQLQRLQAIRNTYEFKLSWKYCLLEPMDIVTLTESTGDGLHGVAVRITKITENADGELDFEAEDYTGSSFTCYTSDTQDEIGTIIDYSVPSGTSTAVVFEPPTSISTTGQLEVWVGASGGQNWGGADVYVSNDDVNYKMLGSIEKAVRQGTLTTTLPLTTTDPDTADTLAVKMLSTDMQLLGGSQADVNAFTPLAYVDGEFIAFRDCAFTGTSSPPVGYYSNAGTDSYSLTYLRRGAYNTNIFSHPVGSQFAMIDTGAYFAYQYTQDRIGSYVYIKLLDKNIFGNTSEDISTVNPIQYKITGNALQNPLPDPANLHVNFVSNVATVYWDAIVDPRTPIQYEIRKGASLSVAQVVGVTSQTSFVPIGDDTYWILARFQIAGAYLYDNNPNSIVVTGSTIQQNIIASYDEAATGWTGTTTSGLNIVGADLELTASGSILAITDMLATDDIINYGGLAQSGTYTLPAGHTISLAAEAASRVAITYAAGGFPINDNILTDANILALVDILGAAYGKFITITPQIRVAPASMTYGPWQNYQPGVYYGKYFQARVQIASNSAGIVGYLSHFTFTVDLPSRTESGTLSTASGGSAITYGSVFNAAPNPQITIVNQQSGDYLAITSISTTGFTVQVLNGGVGVSRTVNWAATSY